jgi:hypothetical protein
MKRIRSNLALLVALLSVVSAFPQNKPAKSKVAQSLTPEQLRAISEPRLEADKELGAELLRYQAPTIARALSSSRDYIGIVTVTTVNPPGKGWDPYLRVSLHLEDLLRGVLQLTELHADSRWSDPPRPNYGGPIILGSIDSTVFDLKEPRIGNRYLIGFYILYEDGGRANITGAVDLDDPSQEVTISKVHHFLEIESASAGTNFAPFVLALADEVRWIRDLSAQRLVQSDACDSSTMCQDAFFASVGQLLNSKKLDERWEALEWLAPFAQPRDDLKKGPNGLPTMSDTSVRELLVSALSDSNLEIADKAFGQLELFDFYNASGPGECIEIVPALRRSARWIAEEAKGSSIGGSYNLRWTFACNP